MNAVPHANRYGFELINAAHDVSHFDCTHQVLNVFLKQSALLETQQDISRTYLLIDTEPSNGLTSVAGFITLATDSIYARQWSDGSTYLYPLVCIQYLARDRNRRGQGIGSLLLIQALKYAVAVANIVGVAGVHLDATIEGRALYKAYGFGEHPYGGNNFLLSIVEARSIVAAS